MKKDVLVLAFYLFTPIEEPKQEVKRFHKFFAPLDATGRIYISEKGINGQMSISKSDAPAFYEWFLGDPRFKETDIKVHHHTEQAFSKMTIKVREQLVAMGEEVDLSKGGARLSAKEWAEMIKERDEDTLILDVRNHYEWEVGHFEGSEKPEFETFSEFPEYAKKLGKTRDTKKTKVMMYCTGGIRCELYSCLLKDQGFDEVFQLDGGVIKYGLEEGTNQWRGKLFVFDDRLVVPINEEEETETISSCTQCECKCDLYYNCANMECNALFLSCLECAKKMMGCCSDRCIEAPRRREFVPREHPKPFRKLPFEEKIKAVSSSQ
ncbi:MAG: Thiosulfate sulfurtransferase GlpE [Chlamydiae bacterium]|nr:Thiosulfate sulfurtransferase GlpE [Chlamydiota bacterium]